MCRGIHGHPHSIFWRLHALYQQYVYSVVFNGLCTSNIFMVLQVVVLWLYRSYKFCIVIYLITKIYLSTKIYVIGGWDGMGLVLCFQASLLSLLYHATIYNNDNYPKMSKYLYTKSCDTCDMIDYITSFLLQKS